MPTKLYGVGRFNDMWFSIRLSFSERASSGASSTVQYSIPGVLFPHESHPTSFSLITHSDVKTKLYTISTIESVTPLAIEFRVHPTSHAQSIRHYNDGGASKDRDLEQDCCACDSKWFWAISHFSILHGHAD